MASSSSPSFRSLLPHEPPLKDDDGELGHVHVQGSFTPKKVVVVAKAAAVVTNNNNSHNNSSKKSSCAFISTPTSEEPPQAPRPKPVEQEGGEEESIHNTNNNNDSEHEHEHEHAFWSNADSLQQVLWNCLGRGQPPPQDDEEDEQQNQLTRQSNPVKDHGVATAVETPNLPYRARQVILLDTVPPFTKLRLVYDKPSQAQAVVMENVNGQLTPAQLLAPYLDEDDEHKIKFSSKPLQWTRSTTKPLPDPSWPRSSPPKFRRLLLVTPQEQNTPDALMRLEHERQTTRFVFVTNLFDSNAFIISNDEHNHHHHKDDDSSLVSSQLSNNPALMQAALRSVFSRYDTSGHDVEIFVHKKKLTQYCHVGMRSASDAQRLIHALQDQCVEWQWSTTTTMHDHKDDDDDKGSTTTTTTGSNRSRHCFSIKSGRLFLDFAAITHRAERQLELRAQGLELPKGEPSRPECTSTTEHVHIPGLSLLSDFVSADEETSLLAVLLGPQAPWAPLQSTPTVGGTVKRRVQHYGYVFDYETANVLRNRFEDPQAQCPRLPVLPPENNNDKNNNDNNQDDLKEHIQHYLEEGRAWHVLAGIIERTRRAKFSITTTNPETDDEKQRRKNVSSSSSSALFGNNDKNNNNQANKSENNVNKKYLSFPNINQLTVNHYNPGEGIGSHVDTPSAFGDGLLSLSLHDGIVMEFRKTSNTTPTMSRKLLYLPPRSLLILSGPARYDWEHMIVTRRTDCVNGTILKRQLRVSLTFRTALALEDPQSPLPRVVSHEFPPTWQPPKQPLEHHDTEPNDSIPAELKESSAANDDNAAALSTPECERQHVHAVYDAIATQWHHTRGRRGVLWPGATQFLQRLPPGSMVADIGCGDGKYFPAIWEAGSYVIGIDMSRPLLRTCFGSSNPWLLGTGGNTNDDDDDDIGNEQPPPPVAESRRVSSKRQSLCDHPAVAVGDCMNVPLRNESCDAAVCIAVLHHISTKERRIRCLQELARIVKPGAFINVQAWSMEQEKDSRRKFAVEDVFVPFNAQPKYLQLPQQEQQQQQQQQQQTQQSQAQEDAGLHPGTAEVSSSKSTAQVYAEAYENAEFDEQKGLVVFQRYCHLYRKGELEDIVAHVPELKVVESGFESGNYFVILQKRP
ncbi:hypothetical protein ACA910_004249 [Epithemia clementina (nom. ined.)]